MSKFRTKNVLFGYFWTNIQKNCHIWNQHPRICLIAKFCEEAKMPKFKTRNALFGCFWARVLKNYCHTWNQHPRICQKSVFNSSTEFWYRVPFFSRSGVRFLWRSRSGSGSALYSMPIKNATIPFFSSRSIASYNKLSSTWLLFTDMFFIVWYLLYQMI